MGGKLLRMAPADLNREERIQLETYNMLLEADNLLHAHRALRRQLCVTRGAVLILILLLCSTFCLLFFIQHTGCRDRGHDTKPKGDSLSIPGARVASRENNTETPHSHVTILCPFNHRQSDIGNMTWKKRERDVVGFSLGKDNESLTVNREGPYRISLQVTYRGMESRLCSSQIQLFYRLVVYSESYGKPKVLLDVYETIFCKEPHWRKTLTSTGVFVLQQRDVLKVESSDLSLLDCDQQVWSKTFFMVHYIPMD